ncbi:hypothetical protein CTI12_AA398640 [Artemisia annua]|uniref:CCHC-type domain-containing protein n=1 Tax=Artemisia annua TaxID=35608 RepID=A0A2U1MBE0_ARTAN|nr:hypothetical protein CTI12_AA398640 [Artemisia annua]
MGQQLASEPRVGSIKKTADLLIKKRSIKTEAAYLRFRSSAVKEEDGSSSLLFSKVDEKEKTKEHKCECCGHENSSQGRPGRGQDKNWKPWKKKDGNQDMSHIRCYKCKELGHYKGECPKMETEANLIKYEDEDMMVL